MSRRPIRLHSIARSGNGRQSRFSNLFEFPVSPALSYNHHNIAVNTFVWSGRIMAVAVAPKKEEQAKST